MKALSVLQPWATLIVIGAKNIETRSFNTKFRGEVLIHASKRFDDDMKEFSSNEPFRSVLINAGYLKVRGHVHEFSLPTGAILGKVTIEHTIKSELVIYDESIDFSSYSWFFSEKEIALGDYSPNRYGWLLRNPVKFDNPIPAKGQLGFWNFDL